MDESINSACSVDVSAQEKTLLVVLGHKNNPTLSLAARLRCQKAAVIIQQRELSLIVTTGAFGGDFNNTNRAHGFLLEKELIEENLKERSRNVRILGITTTFNTVHDLYAIRRVALDNACGAVTIVTSVFHSRRVEEIAKRVMPDLRFEIISAEDGVEVSDREKSAEESKLGSFLRDWVAVPPYRKGNDFPTAFFREIREEHKHYDTLALSIATGALVIGFLPHTQITHPIRLDWWLYLAASLVSFSLFQMYLRCARFARICRLVMEHTEVAWGYPAFSFNIRAFRQRFQISKSRGMKFFVGVIVFFAIAGNGFACFSDEEVFRTWFTLTVHGSILVFLFRQADLWEGILYPRVRSDMGNSAL